MEQFEYTQAIIELKRTLIAHDGLTLTGLAAGLLIWTNVHSLHSWQVVSASYIYVGIGIWCSTENLVTVLVTIILMRLHVVCDLSANT